MKLLAIGVILVGALFLWRLLDAMPQPQEMLRYPLRDGRVVTMSENDMASWQASMKCAAGEHVRVDTEGYVLKLVCSG